MEHSSDAATHCLCAPPTNDAFEGAAARLDQLKLEAPPLERQLADAQAEATRLRECVVQEAALHESTLRALIGALERSRDRAHALGMHVRAIGDQQAVLASPAYRAYMTRKRHFAALCLDFDAIQPSADSMPHLDQEALSGWRYYRPAQTLVPGQYYLCNGFYLQPQDQRTMRVEPHHVVCLLRLCSRERTVMDSSEAQPQLQVRTGASGEEKEQIAYIRVLMASPGSETPPSVLYFGVAPSFLCDLPPAFS
jgi:hypothetical protein